MKKQRIKKLVTGMLAVLALSAVTGCGSENGSSASGGAESTEGLEIRVGNCDYAIWNAQYVIAKEKGFFEEEFADDGITVETYNFANGPAGNEAFTAGELDFFNGMGDQPFISGVGNGISISLLAALNEQGKGNAIIVKNDDEINEIEDLVGKRIGVYIGTQQQKAWLQKLAAVGLGESDVEFVNLTNFSELYAAFEKDEIDSFFATTFNYNSIDDGSIKKIGDFEEYPSRCYLVGSTDFIEKYPELTKRFIEVLKRGQEYLEENPEESYEILSEISNLDINEVKLSTEETKIYLSLDEEVKQGVVDTYDFLKAQGIITFELDNLDEHYEETFVNEVLDES